MDKVKKLIPIRLFPFPFTPNDPNDRIGKIVYQPPVSPQEVAASVASKKADINPKTIDLYASLLGEEQVDLLFVGHPVKTPLCTARLGIKGVFKSATDKFDPERHKLVLQLTPAREITDKLSDLEVEIVGEVTGGPVIGSVYDVISETANNLLTPGNILKVEGDKLKVGGDAPEVGVRFINAEDETVVATLSPKVLAINEPKTLMLTVPPDLPQGGYFIEICTQLTGSNFTVKDARTFRFEQPLVVE